MSGINTFCKKGSNLFLQAYIIIMTVVYPLYVKWSFSKGASYSSIGDDKYFFYKYVTMSMLIIVLAGSIIYIFSGSAKEQFSITEQAVILFAVAATLSFLLSSFRKEAWTGSERWFMGLETLLLIAVTYLLISRMWKYSEYTWISFLAGSAIVYVLGICNRFSFYPIPFEKVAPDFISTLGNINWFCGYFVVMWPIGACLYLFSERRPVRTAAGIYTLIAFATGVTQGSSSAFLSFMAVFYLLLLVCMDKWEKYGRRWVELAAGWCLACQMMRLFRVIFSGKYSYETDNLCGMVTGSSLSLFLLVFAVLLYMMIKNSKFDRRYLKRIFIAVPIGGIVLYFLLAAVNTLMPGGIPGLADKGLFVFNMEWGNARGATWGTGLKLFGRMNLYQKLFGIGPDCFAEYLYTQPDIMKEVHDFFDGAVLKNAHNEWISMLVNTGIVGTAAYIGIFVSLITRFIKKGRDNPVLYIPAVCAFSYMIHNMVSFGQILNMPFIFIIMGMGESYYRQCTEREVV